MARITAPPLRALGVLALLFSLSVPPALAQDVASDDTTEASGTTISASASETLSVSGAGEVDKDVTILVGTKTVGEPLPSDAYLTDTSRITLAAESTESFTLTGSLTSTVDGTSTSGAAEPTNTQPCNNYVEFCERRYSNITEIGAHNSPFVRAGSSASNQQLDVITQLNDGIRFIQAQIQFPSDGRGPHFCHTSCDMLDAGPITDWLTRVREWVDDHPYDVVTILLGNGNYSHPDLYAPHIEASGIVKYAYLPPVFPMRTDDWPPLSQMILRGKRVVMFLDYKADQKAYPWLLDQFSQMWETPFDPVDPTFPPDVQRPPDLSDDAARSRLALFNHNFNAEFNLFGTQILVPAVAFLNRTHAESGDGSLGKSTEGFVRRWGTPPKILNVDYYNVGEPEGSVFRVAAGFNNVTYNGDCCGKVASGAWVPRPAAVLLGFVLLVPVLLA